MFGTCSEHASQIIMDYWYLDFWMYGHGRYDNFENSTFRKREVQKNESAEFLIFEVLGASHESLFLVEIAILDVRNMLGTRCLEHDIWKTMFGTCSEHGTSGIMFHAN